MIVGQCMQCGQVNVKLHADRGFLRCWTCTHAAHGRAGEVLILRHVLCRFYAWASGKEMVTDVHGPMVIFEEIN